MESLYLLVPLSVALVLVTGWAFWRALSGGQFDDLERPGYSVLDDDDSFAQPPKADFDNHQEPLNTAP